MKEGLPERPVNSHNEWDPLEEVIVGHVDGAMFPSWHLITRATIPPDAHELHAMLDLVGEEAIPIPDEQILAAQRCLDELVHILEGEGVTVRRPGPFDFSAPFQTPSWHVGGGFCAANPRDVFLVVGDQMIEAPMADRGRFFEAQPYRALLREYFRRGARWVAAPKPVLDDALYAPDAPRLAKPGTIGFVTTEHEPVFDAADFVRCGRDIFAQRSHVTNRAGIEWLRRHLGEGYRVHELEVKCKQAMHIDTTFMPLAPGKLLVNPHFIDVDKLPAFVRKWDILEAPPPVVSEAQQRSPVSIWMNINVLMLDEKRVLVERRQEPTIKALRDFGLEPIPCNFASYTPFGGSFHCATLDVRRRGELASYF
ncbi:inosamine-phosphate amidinotransferase 1 [Polyangium sp. 15x6]|uniref:inosamine-phosphate amidinotransferase 1 n=1 Tax=Polyangium sp. 15x6 TaxID=3042687 RepID=UPI00249C4900|nr:inosamine-phosphate amidinotransferase 1 [Polyangium sp. 15x6]MDI3288330.1 inosamine-phosphate amidinotransferase 1 [Polyangium sp. 15x6]